MIRLTLGIVVIIAAWLFGIPFPWAVTITVFACLMFVGILVDVIKWANRD